MSERLKLFATTPKGMEQLLADEIKSLGGKHLKPLRAGVEFSGTLETAYRLCLWSRIANRVLLSLPGFEARTPEELYAGIQAFNWDEHLDPEGTLAIDFHISRSKIKHSHYAALKVKDAIVDQLRGKYDTRPSVDTEQPDLRLNIYLVKNQARLSIDLSGESLHRRGYRSEGGGAPLKENLAAAILTLAGWPELAHQGGSLVDPMCGSGTLLIEGALMAGDVAPGLLRDYFGFINWKGHDAALWQRLRAEAETRRKVGLANMPIIQGFDMNTKTVEVARDNAYFAGLADHVQIDKRELSQARPLNIPAGLLVTNPPYGERLGRSQDLVLLYRQLGNLIRTTFMGWRASVFTSEPGLAKQMGLYPDTTHVLFNGAMKCEVYNFAAAKQVTQVYGEVLATETGQGTPDLANRLNKNLKRLGKWARREQVNCYRLYDADLPEYALAIDLYQGEERWVHVQEYQAPASIEPRKAAQRLNDAIITIQQVLEVSEHNLFIKQRRKQKGAAQYEKYDQRGIFHEVQEGPVRCLVNFSDYLDTGLFLDHRLTRALLGSLARGKSFLNLFAYTGVATLHAAAGGAASTLTVDMSNTYLDWAQRNMALNGFAGKQHDFIQADCLEWIQQEIKLGVKYDLIFLDPPSFSNSKRMDGSFDVLRDHVALLREVSQLLAPGGTLIFSNNHRKFKMDREALPGLEITDITPQTLPEDFKRNPKIHNCWRIRVKQNT